MRQTFTDFFWSLEHKLARASALRLFGGIIDFRNP